MLPLTGKTGRSGLRFLLRYSAVQGYLTLIAKMNREGLSVTKTSFIRSLTDIGLSIFIKGEDGALIIALDLIETHPVNVEQSPSFLEGRIFTLNHSTESGEDTFEQGHDLLLSGRGSHPLQGMDPEGYLSAGYPAKTTAALIAQQ